MAVPPFAISENIPGDADIVAQYPNEERTFRDVVESYLNFEHDFQTGRHRFPVDTTANLAALMFPDSGTFRFDTDRDVLEFKRGTGDWTVATLPSGTRTLFFQDAAPEGWSRVALTSMHQFSVVIAGDDLTPSALDDEDTSFETVFTDRPIVQANLPNVNLTALSAGLHSHGGATGLQNLNHNHSYGLDQANGDIGTGSDTYVVQASTFPNDTNGTTNVNQQNHQHSILADGAHTHTVPLGGSGIPQNFRVSRRGAILCDKD